MTVAIVARVFLLVLTVLLLFVAGAVAAYGYSMYRRISQEQERLRRRRAGLPPVPERPIRAGRFRGRKFEQTPIEYALPEKAYKEWERFGHIWIPSKLMPRYTYLLSLLTETHVTIWFDGVRVGSSCISTPGTGPEVLVSLFLQITCDEREFLKTGNHGGAWPYRAFK